MEDKVKKSSWKSTEFLLTMLANAPMLACTLGGEQSVPCLVAGVLATLMYTFKRGTLKEKLVEAAKNFDDKDAHK